MVDNLEPNMSDIDAMLLKEFSGRVSEGDPDAGFDLAQFFWGHLPSNEVNLHIAVIETLILQSAELGSAHAQEYLKEMWPDMKKVLIKRLIARDFKDE